MRKNTLILGIVLFVIGLAMWIMGGPAYENVSKQAQIQSIYEQVGGFGDSSKYDAQLFFWGMFMFIGFILFIVGIIVSIAGASLKEKNTIYQPNTQPQMFYYQQPNQQVVQQRARYCPECGKQLPFNTKYCPQCGNKF
jgi:ABC-type Na+ efflux pump permease subunit